LKLQAISLKERFQYIELTIVALAAAIWYLFPQAGVWPLLLLLLVAAGRFLAYGSIGPRTDFDIPLLLFLVSAAVAVWSAYNQDTAWPKFWLVVGGIAIYYAFAHWAQLELPGIPEQQAILLSLLGAAVASYFVVTHNWEQFPGKVQFLEQIGRSLQTLLPDIPGHRLHPNVAGGILAMTIPFACASIILTKSGGHRPWLFVSIIALLAIMLGLLLTTSRGAWLGLLVAIGIAVWSYIATKLTPTPSNQRYLLFGGLAALLIISVVTLLVFSSGVERIVQLLPTTDAGSRRYDLLRNSLPLVSDYPFIGAGLGGYMMLYSAYSYLIHVGFIVHSHNLFIDIMIEQGFLAIVSLMLMWYLMAKAVWHSIDCKIENLSSDQEITQVPKDLFTEKRIVLWAASLSLITVLFHGLFDDAFYGSRALQLMFLPFAFAVPILALLPRPTKKERLRRVLVATGIILLVLLVWRRPLTSLAYSNYAAVTQSKAELSVYNWPEWPIQDAVRRKQDLSTSIDSYEKALEIYPGNASAARRLGQIELSLGNYAAALGYLKLAYEITPWDNATRQLLGEAYLVNGQLESGKELWKSVNNEEQQLAARVFWYEHIQDEIRRQQLLTAIE
jgi:O-antigen ligase